MANGADQKEARAVDGMLRETGEDVRPGVIRVPGWEREMWLRAGFSTRAGGVTEVYGGRTLNLGWTPEDDPARVSENRRRFAAEVMGCGAGLVGLRQFHSGTVREVDRDARGRLTAEGEEVASGPGLLPVLRGDGLMTDVPGVLLAVGVADCVPVLVADRRRRAVAAFHAGWRGTLARIVERGVERMRVRYGSEPDDLVAAVGPAIGVCCYVVGEELRREFEAEFAYGPELFRAVHASGRVPETNQKAILTERSSGNLPLGTQIYLDLWEANRRQLLDAGLKELNVWVAGECTACTREGGSAKYFSHRGGCGFAGRGLGAVGILDGPDAVR